MRSKLLRLEHLAEQRTNLNEQFMFIDNNKKEIKIINKKGELLRHYTPDAAPTIRGFHNDNHNFHRLVMGPRGSSKSTGCCTEPFFRLFESSPCKDGIKRSRGLIGRNTYGELRTTTIPTFSHWFGLPELNWQIRWQPPITAKLEYFDGEYLNQVEIFFISFDNEQAAKKALSLEISWAYFNEASEISTAAMDETTGSVGRYPAKSDKREDGNYWHGMFYDSNAFATYHPLYAKYVIERPEGHHIYVQPGGLKEGNVGVFNDNPQAENVINLPPNYYRNMAMGKTKEFVRTRICNEFGNFEEGKKCHPEYEEGLHSSDDVAINRDEPIYLAFDYGGSNACVVMQYIAGRLIAVKEMLSVTKSLREFLFSDVQAWLETDGHGLTIGRAIGDPANNYSHEYAHNSHEIVFDVLGIKVQSAFTNDIKARLDAVDQLLLKNISGVCRGS